MRAEISVQFPSGRETIVGNLSEVGSPGRQVVEFQYAPSYLQDPEVYAISPELKLGGGAFTPTGGRTMLGGIADAQPDSWGRRLINAGRDDNTRASEMEVLAAVRDETRQGALRVKVDGEYVGTRSAPTPTIVDLPDLIEAARAFEANEEIPEQFEKLLLVGTSGGGARPKATVLNAAGRLAIAKLPKDDDFGDAMAWEATALELSRRAGINTPPFQHHRTGFQSVVTVERFDRTGDKRVGYLSADSLLKKQPGEIYEYTALAEAIAPISEAPNKDGEELLRRVAFTLLVNNIDDHMKNHGFLRGTKGWRLSPVFDVNPFYSHGSANSTPISPNDDPSNRDIRNLVSSADSFRVTRDDAVRIILEVERATAHWFDVALQFGIAPEGARAMSKAFESKSREIAKGFEPPEPRSVTVTPPKGTQPRTRLGRFDRKHNSNPEAELQGE